MPSLRTTTTRAMVVDDAHKTVASMQGHLYLTAHFIERMNKRANDEQRSFLFFAKCLAHALKNVDKFMTKVIAYRSPKDTIVLRITDTWKAGENSPMKSCKFQVVAMTYWPTSNPDRNLTADLTFDTK